MRKQITALTGVALFATLALAGCSVSTDPVVATPTATESGSESVTASDTASESPSSSSAPEAQAAEDYAALQYLIEEEKLAHDVYLTLYQQWGSKVFGNILESETTHQQRVEDLLDSFAVEDPRDSELGVFNDPELQSLYDNLIAKGLTSAVDAFEVGVIIEEKDIADIQVQLATTTDPQIRLVLESLLKGSQNHLAAFNKQLS